MSYTVKFKCTNCFNIFSKELEPGVSALGRAGFCPKCGCNQDTPGAGGQKIGVFPIVPESDNKVKGDRFEVLLEQDGLTIKKMDERN